LQIEKTTTPKCHRIKTATGKRQWGCEAECTWDVTIVCRKRRIATPKDDNGEPIEGGITKHRRLKCDEETWDEGAGNGSAIFGNKGDAQKEAKLTAVKDAYYEAADKLKQIRCPSACPVQIVAISTEPPTDPSCELDDGLWTCSSMCDYKIRIACAE
jgi:hypothetical protein